jgi:glucose-1-phosphate adenylyltransferase
VVGPGAIIGDGPYDDRPNKQEPSRLNTGITVVGKRAVIPRGTRVGRNVRIAADIRTTDFSRKVIKSGETVEPRPGKRGNHDHAGTVREQPVAAGATGVGRKGSKGSKA